MKTVRDPRRPMEERLAIKISDQIEHLDELNR